MSKHLFRLLFGAFFLVAATAFTGCSDDDDKSLTPKLTADPTALDFTDETATTQTVAITANCEWTVTASNPGLGYHFPDERQRQRNDLRYGFRAARRYEPARRQNLLHAYPPRIRQMGSGRVVRSRKTVRQRGYTPPPRAMLSMLTISIRSRLKRGRIINSPSQMHSRAGRIRPVRVPTMLLIKRAV